MRVRSLTARPTIVSPHLIILALLVAMTGLLGCDPATGTLLLEDGSNFTEQELFEIALRYYETEDTAVLEPLNAWEDAETVIDYVAELDGGYEDWENQDEEGARWNSGLPDCGYLYPWYRYSTWANYLRRSGGNYSFYWSPNCYIQDTWNHCGSDQDNLVSFWMGPDYRVDHNYKVDSTGRAARAWLWFKQNRDHSAASNVRMHDNSTFGNAYFCLPSRFNPEKLRFGR